MPWGGEGPPTASSAEEGDSWDGRLGGGQPRDRLRPRDLEPLRCPSKRPGPTVPAMTGDADLAAVASLLADRGRARMLLALDDGRALAATVLASEAGVAP